MSAIEATVLLPPTDLLSLLDRAAITGPLVAAYYAAYTAYAGAVRGSAEASVVQSGSGVPSELLSEISGGSSNAEFGLRSDISSRSSASTGRAAKRARWRANRAMRSVARQVSSSVSVRSEKEVGLDKSLSEVEVQGRCYGLLLRDQLAADAPLQMTFSDLLDLPEADFKSNQELLTLRICRTGPGRFHVAGVGAVARDVLAAVAVKSGKVFLPGTMGSQMSSTPEAVDYFDGALPGMLDHLGMTSGMSALDRVAAVTHVVIVDLPDPDNFALVAELAKMKGVRVAVYFVVRQVDVNAVPYGKRFGAVLSSLKDAGLDEKTALRCMLSYDSSVPPDVMARVRAPARRMLEQDVAYEEDFVRSLYTCASRYRLQLYLAAAGVDLDRVLLFSDVARHATVMKHAAHKDDYCFSMSEPDWKRYSTLMEQSSEELYIGGKGMCTQALSRMRIAELRRLARGKLLVPTMAFSTFAAVRQSSVELVVGGPFTPVPHIMESLRVSWVLAMAGTRDVSVNVFPEQFNIAADPEAFAQFVEMARQRCVGVELITTDVSKTQFKKTITELGAIRARHRCGLLFDRWGIKEGMPLFDYDLAFLVAKAPRQVTFVTPVKRPGQPWQFVANGAIAGTRAGFRIVETVGR